MTKEVEKFGLEKGRVFGGVPDKWCTFCITGWTLNKWEKEIGGKKKCDLEIVNFLKVKF